MKKVKKNVIWGSVWDLFDVLFLREINIGVWV